MQDSIDQELIVCSISVDTDKGQVSVCYPFTQDPIEYLSKFHGGGLTTSKNSTRHTISSVASQSLSRQESGFRVAHQELVEKNFMKKLSDFSSAQQAIIQASKFKHYFVWSSVLKDSESTPVRLVVEQDWI